MEGKLKDLFLPIVYGLESILDASSFLVFLTIFLIMFVVGFFVIINYLELGAFIGKTIYSPSLYTIFAGEIAFIVSILVIIFSICVLFYYKTYYIVSKNLKFTNLLRGSILTFPKFIIATFVQFVVSIIGLVAFLVPGVYYGSSLMFFGFFCTYNNSTIYSAYSRSRGLAKSIRLKSMISFFVYLVLLFVAVYILIMVNIGFVYRGLFVTLFLSYWIVSYSNTVFVLADKNYNLPASESHISRIIGKYLRQ